MIVQPGPVTHLRAVKVRPGRRVELPEAVATEEPLQILVCGPGGQPAPLALTMRTPGSDFELAAGFVVTEALARPEEVRAVSHCADLRYNPDPDRRFNAVTVRLARAPDRPEGPYERRVSSSCGVCGKTSIEELARAAAPVGGSKPLPAELLWSLPGRLRAAQKAFERTGGLHAAGLFRPDASMEVAREDVGRHNAVDKVIGHLVLEGGQKGLPADLAGWVLVVSGRVSFEIVQKAAQVGLGTIVAVSAPSSLAVQAAQQLGVTVVAFVRGSSLNIYSHPERVG